MANSQDERKPSNKSDSGTLVRINASDKALLQTIADEEGESMPRILHKAIELYRRDRFLREVNEGYRKLAANSDEWSRENSERKVWDSTHTDGVTS